MTGDRKTLVWLKADPDSAAVVLELECDRVRSKRRFEIMVPRLGAVAAEWPQAQIDGSADSRAIRIWESLSLSDFDDPRNIDAVQAWLEARMLILRSIFVHRHK
jgi:hypothetical protein